MILLAVGTVSSSTHLDSLQDDLSDDPSEIPDEEVDYNVEQMVIDNKWKFLVTVITGFVIYIGFRFRKTLNQFYNQHILKRLRDL